LRYATEINSVTYCRILLTGLRFVFETKNNFVGSTNSEVGLQFIPSDIDFDASSSIDKLRMHFLYPISCHAYSNFTASLSLIKSIPIYKRCLHIKPSGNWWYGSVDYTTWLLCFIKGLPIKFLNLLVCKCPLYWLFVFYQLLATRSGFARVQCY
jgi:hypothetical protein